MAYSVYKARFKTERGTYRAHVGHTRNLNLRKHRHRKKPPAWLKPKAGEPTFSVLEEELQTKEDVPASEALHSARILVASPELARGGPWVKPTLPDGALEEARRRQLPVSGPSEFFSRLRRVTRRGCSGSTSRTSS